jgi:uncharacterized membrane protein
MLLKLLLFGICLFCCSMVLSKPVLKKPIEKIFLHVKWSWLISAILLGFFAFYVVLKGTQHFSLNTNAYDLSVFDYALWNTVHGKMLFVPFWGNSFFYEHFSPVLLLLVPVYALFSTPVTLLVLQCAAIALAAWPLYRIAERIWGNKPLAAILILVFLNNWYVVHGVLYEVHIEMIVPLLVFLMFWSWLQKNYFFYFVWLVLALMCKEDMGVYLFGFGCFLIWKEKKMFPGLWTAGSALFWVIGSLFFVNQLNHGYTFVSNWNPEQLSLGPLLLEQLRAPWKPLLVFCTPAVSRILLTVFFLPLFSWWGLICLLPIWVQASSANTLQANFALYYAAPVLPFLFISTVFGLKTLMEKWPLLRVWLLTGVGCFLVVFNLHVYPPDSVLPRHKMIHEFLQTIPVASSIASQGNLVPHLKHSNQIQVLPKWETGAETILFDFQGNPFPMQPQEQADLYQEIMATGKYRKTLEKDGFVVLRRIP